MDQALAPTAPAEAYFKDTQIAKMLGLNPVTVRQWRVKNKKAGSIKHGPPYEVHGTEILYPKSQFRQWCAAVEVVGGVPRVNLPVSADLAAIQQATANAEDPFAELARLTAVG